MKLFLKILLSVVILFILISGSGMFFLSRGLEAGKALEINSIDLSAVEDGTYKGAYKDGRWTNEVSVTVKEHRITRIEIVKDVLFPRAEVATELISKVIEKQDLNIDSASGATVTCKAYLKSIENALRK